MSDSDREWPPKEGEYLMVIMPDDPDLYLGWTVVEEIDDNFHKLLEVSPEKAIGDMLTLQEVKRLRQEGIIGPNDTYKKVDIDFDENEPDTTIITSEIFSCTWDIKYLKLPNDSSENIWLKKYDEEKRRQMDEKRRFTYVEDFEDWEKEAFENDSARFDKVYEPKPLSHEELEKAIAELRDIVDKMKQKEKLKELEATSQDSVELYKKLTTSMIGVMDCDADVEEK